MRKSKEIHVRRIVRRGFTLVELTIVAAIMLCLGAIAIPNIATALANSRLHTAMGNVSGITQTCRMQAVKQNVTQWLQFKTVSGRAVAFVKKSTAAADAPIDPIDPQLWLPSAMQKYTAPVGVGAPTPLTAEIMWGGGPDPSSTQDTYFNARGLPCTMTGGVCSPTSGFLYYFSYTRAMGNPGWAALGISPAGRIRVWYWNGSSWGD